MIDVAFLGTSGSTPTRDRSLPSVAIEFNGDIYLFDCGEGTQRQFMIYGLSTSKIHSIFITHMHGDHVIGIAGLMRTLALNNRTEPLYIYVPEGEEEKAKALATFDKAMFGYDIAFVGVRSGTVMRGKGFEIDAFRLNHSVKSYGYVFREDDKLHFIKDKCKMLGIKGTMFSQLERGETLTINKKRVKLKDVTHLEKGKRVVYATDSRPAATTVSAAKNADLLIHEATYSNELKDFASKRKHSTAMEAAEVAKKADVKQLILFHPSARYKDTGVLVKEARSVFKNTRMAMDGMKIHL